MYFTSLGFLKMKFEISLIGALLSIISLITELFVFHSLPSFKRNLILKLHAM